MSRTQDPNHGVHLRLPDEVARLEKAVAFFTEQKDEKMLSQIVPQLAGAKDRLAHTSKAVAFVEELGLSHEVTTGSYTFNDAVGLVAKVLHEHEHGVPSLYSRAHKHLAGVNDDAHCCPVKVKQNRDPVAELVDHLGLSNEKHIEAAKSLFGKAE